jgi:hypothetical protein
MKPSQSRNLKPGKNTRPQLAAPQPTPLRPPRVSPHREGPRVRRRGLYVGLSATDCKPMYLGQKHLRTHLHLIGPTGSGKSRLLLWLFELLCYTDRPIVLIDPKGGLYRMARDWAMTNGFQKRLILFDLGGDILPGYNPLRESDLRIDLQAQWVREGVRSAWGASTFDATPLLARMLYLCLYTARALSVSLMDAIDVLRPSPILRHRALKEISDPFVFGALQAFDQLSDRVKAEQSSSTISRLEMFFCDTVVRQVVCSPQSLDLGDLLAQRKIILVNFAKYQPLLPDSLKLLGRMFFNDLLANVYRAHGEGKFDEENPCYVICDEVQNFATRQVCDALDEGGGIGFHSILAHQHLSQLKDEDQSGYLYHSVMADARTKILFPGIAAEDLEVFAKTTLLKTFNPLAVKHVQRTPIFVPKESRRLVKTLSVSQALSASTTESKSKAESVSFSQQSSVTRGRSIGESLAHSEGGSESHTQGRNSSTTESSNWSRTDSQNSTHTRSHSHSSGQAASHGRGHASSTGSANTQSRGQQSASGQSQGVGTNTGTSSGEGQTMLPPEEGLLFDKDPEVVSLSTHTGATAGESSFVGSNTMQGFSSALAQSTTASESSNSIDTVSASTSNSVSESESDGSGVAMTEGDGIAHQIGESESDTTGTNWNRTRGLTVTESENMTEGLTESHGETLTEAHAVTAGETNTRGGSVSLTPFYEYVREDVLSPVFLSPEEQLLLEQQRLAKVRPFYFNILLPQQTLHPTLGPWVGEPTITRRRLAAGHDYVFGRMACTRRLADPDGQIIEVEAREVNVVQHTPALPSPTPADPEVEEALWKRWHSMSRGRQENS